MTLTPIVITISATHSRATVLMIPVEKKKTKQKANAYDPIWAVSRCEWKPRAKPQHGCSQHGGRGPTADLRTVPQPCPPRPTNYFLTLHWALFLFLFFPPFTKLHYCWFSRSLSHSFWHLKHYASYRVGPSRCLAAPAQSKSRVAAGLHWPELPC